VDQYASLCQISSKSVKQWQSNGELTVFKITVVHHLGFLKFKFLTVDSYDTHKRPIWHHCTKFRKERSNHFEDVTIFVIFQDGGRRHLGFKKILNFNGRSAASDMRHHAKFHRSPLNGCRDMAI